MAKFGKWNVSANKGVDFMSTIMKTVRFVLYLYVGGVILVAIGAVLNLSGNPFTSSFTLLGYTAGASGATLSSTGLLSIVGLLGTVNLITGFVNVRRA